MDVSIRNKNLINQVKKIWLQSVKKGVVSNFKQLYKTTSKSSLLVKSKLTNGGVQYTVRLSILFPGLDETNFPDIHTFLNNNQNVVVELNSGSVYALSSIDNPLKMSSSFSLEKGFTISFAGVQIKPINTIATPYEYIQTNELAFDLNNDL